MATIESGVGITAEPLNRKYSDVMANVYQLAVEAQHDGFGFAHESGLKYLNFKRFTTADKTAMGDYANSTVHFSAWRKQVELYQMYDDCQDDSFSTAKWASGNGWESGPSKHAILSEAGSGTSKEGYIYIRTYIKDNSDTVSGNITSSGISNSIDFKTGSPNDSQLYFDYVRYRNAAQTAGTANESVQAFRIADGAGSYVTVGSFWTSGDNAAHTTSGTGRIDIDYSTEIATMYENGTVVGSATISGLNKWYFDAYAAATISDTSNVPEVWSRLRLTNFGYIISGGSFTYVGPQLVGSPQSVRMSSYYTLSGASEFGNTNNTYLNSANSGTNFASGALNDSVSVTVGSEFQVKIIGSPQAAQTLGQDNTGKIKAVGVWYTPSGVY